LPPDWLGGWLHGVRPAPEQHIGRPAPVKGALRRAMPALDRGQPAGHHPNRALSGAREPRRVHVHEPCEIGIAVGASVLQFLECLGGSDCPTHSQCTLAGRIKSAFSPHPVRFWSGNGPDSVLIRYANGTILVRIRAASENGPDLSRWQSAFGPDAGRTRSAFRPPSILAVPVTSRLRLTSVSLASHSCRSCVRLRCDSVR
jgi:hypothetical protein